MPEPLDPALAQLRTLLLSEHLFRAVASGRRRGMTPAHQRADLKPVQLASGPAVSVIATDGRSPVTRNLRGTELEAEVDRLLGEPFGNWVVTTTTEEVSLRVTKSGQAQVHRGAGSGRAPDLRHDRPKARQLADDDAVMSEVFTQLSGTPGAGAAKRRQVEAFLRMLDPATRAVRQECAEQGRELNVVDLGCGNAYLTFAAHRWLSQQAQGTVRTTGIDTREASMARNRDLADQLGLGEGLQFVASSIAQARLDFTPDVVLALHACDTATDEALAAAVTGGARVILAAPCCHHDLSAQLKQAWSQGEPPAPFAAVARDGILRERLADSLTDTARAAILRLRGYRVDVVEFIDSSHTPRNLMLRATYTGARPDDRRQAEYTDLINYWNIRPALGRMLELEAR